MAHPSARLWRQGLPGSIANTALTSQPSQQAVHPPQLRAVTTVSTLKLPLGDNSAMLYRQQATSSLHHSPS